MKRIDRKELPKYFLGLGYIFIAFFLWLFGNLAALSLLRCQCLHTPARRFLLRFNKI